MGPLGSEGEDDGEVWVWGLVLHVRVWSEGTFKGRFVFFVVVVAYENVVFV